MWGLKGNLDVEFAEGDFRTNQDVPKRLREADVVVSDQRDFTIFTVSVVFQVFRTNHGPSYPFMTVFLMSSPALASRSSTTARRHSLRETYLAQRRHRRRRRTHGSGSR